jgi:hypothetical protein
VEADYNGKLSAAMGEIQGLRWAQEEAGRKLEAVQDEYAKKLAVAEQQVCAVVHTAVGCVCKCAEKLLCCVLLHSTPSSTSQHHPEISPPPHSPPKPPYLTHSPLSRSPSPQVIAERAGREEVTTTIARLQSSIASVKEEMAAQQAESERARLELELERSARLTAEGNAAMLRWAGVAGSSCCVGWCGRQQLLCGLVWQAAAVVWVKCVQAAAVVWVKCVQVAAGLLLAWCMHVVQRVCCD